MVLLDVNLPQFKTCGIQADWLDSRNLPLGAAILILVLLSFKLRSIDTPSQRLDLRTKLHSMDPLGILFLLGAVCSLLLVLKQGGNAWHWKSGKVIGLLVTFVTLFALFGAVQWKLGERATIPLRLLRDRTVLSGSLFLAISNTSSYVVSLLHRKRYTVASSSLKDRRGLT